MTDLSALTDTELSERLGKAMGWRFDRTWLDEDGRVRDIPHFTHSLESFLRNVRSHAKLCAVALGPAR